MENLQLTMRKHSQSHNQIVVDQYTGQMFIKTPGFDLMFPMLVVRHGQTNGNINRKFQGQIDTPESSLNAVGKEQVKQAARQVYDQLKVLLGHNLQKFAGSGKLVILKSPLSRAQDTARAFIEYFERQTGISLNSRLSCSLRYNPVPVSSGIIRSRSIRSGALLFTKSSACAPSPAVETLYPTSSRRLLRNSRTSGSSSTTSMFFAIFPSLEARDLYWWCFQVSDLINLSICRSLGMSA